MATYTREDGISESPKNNKLPGPTSLACAVAAVSGKTGVTKTVSL